VRRPEGHGPPRRGIVPACLSFAASATPGDRPLPSGPCVEHTGPADMRQHGGGTRDPTPSRRLRIGPDRV